MIRFFSILFVLVVTACNSTSYPDREPKRFEDVAVDSIHFWPRALRYARPGDTVSILVTGLRRGYVCAKLNLDWDWLDSTDQDAYTFQSLVRTPGTPECALDVGGLDTLFKRVFSTQPAEKLYLRTADGKKQDSLLYLSGDGYTETFTHLVSAPDSAAVGSRYWFHDSGAGRTRRFVVSNSMAACETFQSAAFKRSGDTLTVRVRRILAVPMSPALFPPCAGPHADTVEVVFDQHRFP
jgi:hypothetical protein